MQFALTAISGFISGGPAGALWAAGSYLATNALTPRENIIGPRLSDLTVQSSEFGRPIPRMFGQTRLGGNVIWCPGIKEVKKVSGGGGNSVTGKKPKVTEYKYFVSMAVLFCENQTTRYEKIWMGSTLIYDYNGGDEKGYKTTYDPATGVYSAVSFNPAQSSSVGSNPLWSTVMSGTSNRSDGSKMRFYTGTDNQPPDSLIQQNLGVNRTSGHPGMSYIVIEEFPLENYGNSIQPVTALLRNTVTNSADIVRAILNPVGYDNSELQLAALEGLTVRGFTVESVEPAKNSAMSLASIKHVLFTDTGDKMEAVKMGSSPSFTIPQSDQGAVNESEAFSSGDGQLSSSAGWKRSNKIDIPRVKRLQFINPLREHREDSRSHERMNVPNKTEETVSTTVVMMPSEAQQWVDVKHNADWAESDYYETDVGWKYQYLTAADVGRINVAKENRPMVIQKVTERFFGIVSIEAHSYDRSAYDHPLGADTEDLPPVRVETYGAIHLAFINTNSAQDSMNGAPGFYIAVTSDEGSLMGSITFENSHITTSDGDGELETASPCDMGVVVSRPPMPYSEGITGFGFWDDQQTMTVELYRGVLDSIDIYDTEEAYGNTNAAIVGREILKWANAEWIQNPDEPDGLWDGKRRYVLSGLARGLRGTEQFMDHHYNGEPFVVLNSAVMFATVDNEGVDLVTRQWEPQTKFKESDTVRPVTDNGYVYSPNDDGKSGVSEPGWPTNLGAEVNDGEITWTCDGPYQGITITVSGVDAAPVRLAFLVPATNLMPYSVAQFNPEWDELVTEVVFSWNRRSRYTNPQWSSGGAPPLGEASEKYEIDILDEAGNVVRTFRDITSPTKTYTMAQITTDFGGVPVSFNAVCYQISERVGRGYPEKISVIVPEVPGP